MKILLIEDNHFKRDKIIDFIKQSGSNSIHEAASYNRGLSIGSKESFDLMILDMSMPTFDRTETDRGGRFRVLAGKEIAARLQKQGKLPPFVVLTGYTDFSDEQNKLNLAQINDLLALFGEAYKGIIFFDSTGSVWKEKLTKIIDDLANA